VRLLTSELAQAKYVTPDFNSKWKFEKLAAVVRVLQNMQNLVLCRGLRRNVQRFITHVHNHCFVWWRSGCHLGLLKLTVFLYSGFPIFLTWRVRKIGGKITVFISSEENDFWFKLSIEIGRAMYTYYSRTQRFLDLATATSKGRAGQKNSKLMP